MFTAKPQVRIARTNNSESGGSSVDWLSNSNLVNAVKEGRGTTRNVEGITITDNRNVDHILRREIPTASVGTITPATTPGGLVGSGGDFTGTPGGPATFLNFGSRVGTVTIEAPGQEGDASTIRLIHTRGRTMPEEADGADREGTYSDYLVYGIWMTGTAADAGSPTNTPTIETLVAGTLPYRTDDLPTTGDARYIGKALGYHKIGSDPLRPWVGTADLKANFSRGTSKISGSINTGVEDPDTDDGNGGHTHFVASLGNHPVGGSGKVTGIGSGTWKASFYGTPINAKPSGIAGDFETERAARAAGTQITTTGGVRVETELKAVTAATFQGAFGAHEISQLAEDNQ